MILLCFASSFGQRKGVVEETVAVCGGSIVAGDGKAELSQWSPYIVYNIKYSDIG
jgi:hypothetical protein